MGLTPSSRPVGALAFEALLDDEHEGVRFEHLSYQEKRTWARIEQLVSKAAIYEAYLRIGLQMATGSTAEEAIRATRHDYGQQWLEEERWQSMPGDKMPKDQDYRAVHTLVRRFIYDGHEPYNPAVASFARLMEAHRHQVEEAVLDQIERESKKVPATASADAALAHGVLAVRRRLSREWPRVEPLPQGEPVVESPQESDKR